MSVFLILAEEPAPVPVTNMFDVAGDDVDEWDEAYTFVAGPLADGTWFSDCAAAYQEKKLS